jgi:glutamine amidotransferase
VKLAIIDYGAGNIASVERALKHLGAECFVTKDANAVRAADKLILPGVGNFAATSALDAGGLRDSILGSVAAGAPFLGICVGMQWMFAGSSEAENTKGAGWIDAVCQRFPQGSKCPHVGWNQLQVKGNSKLLRNVSPGESVYFSHSYRASCSPWDIAVTDYCGPFSAAIEKGNIFGVQFHPEKSGEAGLKILKNFLELC